MGRAPRSKKPAMKRGILSEESFPFLREMTDAGRRELCALPRTEAAPHRGLLRRGDAIDGVYLVVRGALRVFYLTSNGREATLYRVLPGGTCVLALSAAFRDEPYPAWVEAGGRGASFVRVPGGDFRRLLASEAGFRDFLFGALTGRIFELMQRLEELGTASMERRVARALWALGGSTGIALCTQGRLAAELGTAREVVFRTLRSLAARGIVRPARGRIYLDDMRALRALGED